MSADAKAWSDGDGWSWRGSHDGTCRGGAHAHHCGDDLRTLLEELEYCQAQSLRWEICVYPDGRTGLLGYLV